MSTKMIESPALIVNVVYNTSLQSLNHALWAMAMAARIDYLYTEG